MKKVFSLLAVSFLLLASSVHAGQDAREIVKKALHVSFYQGQDRKAVVNMRIIDKQGRARTRHLIMLRRNRDQDNGPQKYYLFFKKPFDVKKMVFMAWKNIDRGDDRWLYLPSLDLVKRIAASDERTSFVGSHFYYEDVSGRNLDEDLHEFIEETDQHYVIKSTPRDPDSVEFFYYINWIDKETFLPMKTQYFNQKEIVYRTYTAVKIDEIDGYATATTIQMEDNMTGGKTIVDFSSIKYTLGLPENIFTERFLRRPPKKYLK